MRSKKRKESEFLKYLGKTIWFILKIPYYLLKGAYYLGKKISEGTNDSDFRRTKKNVKPKYEDFKVLQVSDGKYSEWIDHVSESDSQIGIILGARGSGKTAFGIKFLENFHSKYDKTCFAIGFHESEMPSWINVVSDIKEIENNSMVLIDEGGVLLLGRQK